MGLKVKSSGKFGSKVLSFLMECMNIVKLLLSIMECDSIGWECICGVCMYSQRRGGAGYMLRRGGLMYILYCGQRRRGAL